MTFKLTLTLLLVAFAVGLNLQNSNVDRLIASNSTNQFLTETNQANRLLLSWYDQKSNSLQGWMDKRGSPDGPPDFIDFYFPEKDVSLEPLSAEMVIANKTKELFHQYFPSHDPSSYVGTFFESGHPYIQTKRGPYQWDSMEASGISDPKVFRKVVSSLRSQGIKAMRLGPNIHEVEIGKLSSWNSFIEKLEIIWQAGGTPTISMAFFPSLKKWEVKDTQGRIDYKQSYLLNPTWPLEMGQLTQDMMKRIWEKVKELENKNGRKLNVVINPINEPETLAGFNRHFWHGAFANWGHPETMRYYIPSIIQIAKANVSIRKAVEESSPEKRILFMHNEAMTPSYYPSHRGYGRFAVSKFMLGDESILNADFKALAKIDLKELELQLTSNNNPNEIEWSLKEYIFGNWNKSQESKEKAREEIINQFRQLKEMHLSFQSQFNKTMRTDTMLHLDYYYQTEFIPNKKIPELIDDLSFQNGKALKEILGFKDDTTFLNALKRIGSENTADLPVNGPKGPLLHLDFKEIDQIDFKELLSRDDFVILERSLGLRREYSLSDEEPYASRQKRAGLRPLNNQLYRSDEILETLSQNYVQILEVQNLNEMKKILAESAKITGTDIRPEMSVRDVLSSNGRAILHHLMGMRRNFLLGFEPQHYARQIRAGIRYGFYIFFMDYVKALKIYTAGVGESGTPFYIFAPLLHDQVMLEYVRALKNGIYGTQYSLGPAVNTRGWAKAPLGLHYEDDHEINPSGILNIDELGRNEKIWVSQFLEPLFDALR